MSWSPVILNNKNSPQWCVRLVEIYTDRAIIATTIDADNIFDKLEKVAHHRNFAVVAKIDNFEADVKKVGIFKSEIHKFSLEDAFYTFNTKKYSTTIKLLKFLRCLVNIKSVEKTMNISIICNMEYPIGKFLGKVKIEIYKRVFLCSRSFISNIFNAADKDIGLICQGVSIEDVENIVNSLDGLEKVFPFQFQVNNASLKNEKVIKTLETDSHSSLENVVSFVQKYRELCPKIE